MNPYNMNVPSLDDLMEAVAKLNEELEEKSEIARVISGIQEPTLMRILHLK